MKELMGAHDMKHWFPSALTQVANVTVETVVEAVEESSVRAATAGTAIVMAAVVVSVSSVFSDLMRFHVHPKHQG